MNQAEGKIKDIQNMSWEKMIEKSEGILGFQKE